MVFLPPSWVPPLPDASANLSLPEFITTEKFGRHAWSKSRPSFTCGITGQSQTPEQLALRVDLLSRGLNQALGFDSQGQTEWDRVVAIYSVNAVDYLTSALAVHRLSGIVTPASASHSASELEHQLRSSGAKALFTCIPLLDVAKTACKAVDIPEENIFILPLPNENRQVQFKTVETLIADGKSLPELPPLKWVPGQGARQVAFLSFSSGTSGLPKAVKISHHNVISNVLQTCAFDAVGREAVGVETQTIVGVLPFSHIYGLVLVSLVAMYRGDEVVVLPRYDFDLYLNAIARFKVQQLHIVPPILIQMLSNKEKCMKFDLGNIRLVHVGAAPLAQDTITELLDLYPNWKVGQGYGLTEASPGVSSTSEHDLFSGSAGSLLPGTKAKLVGFDNAEVTSYDTPGELLIQSPSIALGYLNNEKATAETFFWDQDGRWMRTGDEVVVRKSPLGNEHFIVVDRIKELIKVKGHQVAPAELEGHVLKHEYVSDCAVIGIFDKRAGEVPKAFVVRSEKAVASGHSDDEIRQAINTHVGENKSRHKWLKGGIEFVDVIPKSPSGKILRRLLKQSQNQADRPTTSKL